MTEKDLSQGATKSLVYGVWQTMRNRCNNPNVRTYPNYGGRGIKVCPEWDRPDGFAAFSRDMGPRPNGYQIERKDNDGDYCPDNCVWANRKDQTRNKRNTRLITDANGRTQALADWAVEMGCHPAAILNRISRGMTETEAVTKTVPERANGKLTIEQVREIKFHRTESNAKLAREFGVASKSIFNIRHGVTFDYVKQQE